MFRKLRLRLTLINIAIIAALFIILTTGTYLTSSAEMNNRALMLVQRVASDVTSGMISDFPPPGSLLPPGSLPPHSSLLPYNEPTPPGNLPPPGNHPFVPFVFFVKVAPSGTVTFTSSSSPLTESEANSLVTKTLEIVKATGTVNFERKVFYYSRSTLPTGEQLLVFHDPFEQKDMLKILLMALAITGLVCLILSFFGSFFMANRAMVPIEEAWQQQQNFLADASHELRTPLAVIQTNLEVVRSNHDELVGNQDQWLSNIQEELKQMTKLVDSLLFLARADARQLLVEHNCFSVNAAILQAIKPFKPIANAKNVEIKVFADPIIFNGDEVKIKQIISILLDNALRYTPSGGSITVQLQQSEGTVRLDVIDTGSGIPAAHLEKIFDRFYQVDPSRAKEAGGVGLGLAIAKCLVECHYGRIIANSTPGEGSTFSVYLPFTKESCNNT